MENIIHVGEKKKIKDLQSARNSFLRSKPPPSLLHPRIDWYNKLISDLQQECVTISQLRSGTQWMENSEKSTKYLATKLRSRQMKQTMHEFQNPISDDAADRSDDTDTMKHYAATFYRKLFDTEPIHQPSIDSLLQHITPSQQLTPSHQRQLTTPFTINDLITQSARCATNSSPGLDGLGYPFLSLIFSHPLIAPIVLHVYNSALNGNGFPSSWQDITMRLLPKKGDLGLLKNWRPISLINCDAKIFTRLINARLAPIAGKILTPYQTGFMPKRYIADNFFLLRTIMQLAPTSAPTAIGLLLDQEKAYDRIHPSYLAQTMKSFGIPSSFSDMLISLFFSNRVQVNINGHLTNPITQLRGLRQGDPLSPILFNFALEPLLLSIMADSQIQGISTNDNSHSITTKVLAYADDICLFLSTPSEFDRAQDILNTYCRASNAKLNIDKTQAFSLSGDTLPHWKSVLQANDITQWFDKHSPSYLTYLGYPLVYTTGHLKVYASTLLAKINKIHHFLSLRHLTYKGKVTVCNALFSSKLWHVLRLVPLPKWFFKSLRASLAKFINGRHILLRLSIAHLCKPVDQGGLGLIDPEAQQIALQYRWLPHILDPPNTSSSPLSFWIQACFVSIPSPYNSLFYFSLPFQNQPNWLPFHSPFILISKLLSLFKIDPINLSWSITMCLDAPLWSLFQIPPTHWLHKKSKKNKSKNYHSLRGKDVFLSCGPNQPLSLLPSISPDVPLGRSYLKQIQSTTGLNPRFSFAPHVAMAFVPPADTNQDPPLPHGLQIWNCIRELHTNSQQIRLLHYQAHYPVFLGPSPISSQLWIKFWKIRLSPTARNVWYRLISNKWPALTRLHHFMPNEFPSPCCPHCPSRYQTAKHLALECSSSFVVWQSLWQHHFPDLDFSPDYIWYSLLFLRPSPHPHLVDNTQWFQLLGSTLHSIWRSHWSYIFDHIPVRTSTMLSNIASSFQAIQHPITSSVDP
jgi:hypothetical protein